MPFESKSVKGDQSKSRAVANNLAAKGTGKSLVIQRVTDEEYKVLEARFRDWQRTFDAKGLLSYWMDHSPLVTLRIAKDFESLAGAVKYLDSTYESLFQTCIQQAKKEEASGEKPAAKESAEPKEKPKPKEKPEQKKEEAMSDDEGTKSPVRTSAEPFSVAGYLEDLDKRAKEGPKGPLGGIPRITTSSFKPPAGAVTSKSVNKNNNECVLAAFRSAKPGVNDRDLLDKMTSTEEGIAMTGKVYGMVKISAADLKGILKAGKRAFINAPAMEGSGYHAYAAFGIDDKTGKIIAWDPDNTHADVKLVPFELVISAYA
ncbi:MAG TPA: hypothetical protein VFE32_11165 [Puia sp.]|jgi:hypothetical protein|nr:hypothetical protein [Puia sp.]